MDDLRSGGFRVGSHRVDPLRGQIASDTGETHVEPRAMDVLVALAQRAGETLSRDELILAVWKHPHVSDEALTRCISLLRQALGDDGSRRRTIETIPKRGYRLVAPVEKVATAPVNGKPVRAPPVGVAVPDWSRTNLRLPLTRLIGRETEVDEVQRLLAEQRLVTLAGSAGVGKTRLAVEVGRQSLRDHVDGVWMVELAPLSDASLVASTVATVLGVELGRRGSLSPAMELARLIGHRDLLVILDNCEHVVDAVAELAETVLGMAPQTRILATSQSLIRIAGEQVYHLPSLPFPQPDDETFDDVLRSAAVQLFVERARAADSHFSVDDGNAGKIASICRRLDGIPLAIEMAAARAPALGVEQLDRRLDERFRILNGGRRTALPRHRTLRATLDWSFGLLAEAERTTLARLGVFAGSFTLEAATAVVADGAIGKGDVADLLARLGMRSLVVSEPHDSGMRHRLLQTTRAYALERLDAAGESAAVRNRHLHFYLDRVLEVSPNRCNQPDWVGILHLDKENLLAAHAWCDHAPDGGALGLKLAFELKDYWVHRGGLEIGYQVTTEALARPGAQPRNDARSFAVYTAALLATCMGRYREALAHRHECLSIAREIGNARTTLFALLSLGEHHVVNREFPEARRYIEEAVTLAGERKQGNEWICALLALGDLERLEGNVDAAQACNEECLALARVSSERRHQVVTLNNLALLSLVRGSASGSPAKLVEALAISVEIGSKTLQAYTLLTASGLAATRGEHRRTVELYAAGSRFLDEVGYRLEPADEAVITPLVQRARGALGADNSVAAEADGRALSIETAIDGARRWLENLVVASERGG